MRILGIDPGLKGGIALLTSIAPGGFKMLQTAKLVMPVQGHVIQVGDIVDWIARQNPEAGVRDIHAFIEQVGAMPKQGLSSTFKFGTGYGQVIGMCQTLRIPFTLVTPQKWKGEILAGTAKDKDAAIAYCRREFPTINLIPERCRVPHDGLADALCIAAYGMRHVS